MIGLLVIIVISWGLLYLIEKKHISVLGIIPNKMHCIQFLIGFLFIGIIMLLWIYIETYIRAIIWQSKPISYRSLLGSLFYHFKSALTEDLVFRGAILYILIRKIGAKTGILISALSFGIYHVFSYGMSFEKIIPILYVVLVTGFTGYVWAYTFEKTKSVSMGFGFHVGNNFILSCFFPSPVFGELILNEVSGLGFQDWSWLFFYIAKGLFPGILTLLFIKLMLKYSCKFMPTNAASSYKSDTQ